MKIWTILFLLPIVLLNCTKESIAYNLPANELFEISKDAFDKGKYDRAIDGFKKLVFEHPGSELIDKAQFYLAESYFGTKDYEGAIVEYRFFIDNFPESPYLDDVAYKLGLAYYKISPPYYLEQKRTEDALKIIGEFIIRFPESEWIEEAKKIEKKCLDKLSKKQLENGKLYYKLGHYRSAEVYLEDLLGNYPTSSYIDESKFTLALCYKKLGEEEEAREVFVSLVENDGEFAERARKELRKLSKRE